MEDEIILPNTLLDKTVTIIGTTDLHRLRDHNQELLAANTALVLENRELRDVLGRARRSGIS